MNASAALAPFRQELALLPAPRREDGSPAWTLHDPVRNRYFRIGWREFELLSRWGLGDAGSVAAAVSRETPLEVERGDVEALERFLAVNQLLSPEDAGSRARLRPGGGKPGGLPWKKLLHNYLFFRLPLWRPDRFLDATLGWARPFQSTWFAILSLAAGLFGGFLAVRQWDGFVHHAARLFSLEGLLWFLAALLVSKLVHELGHAYALKRHGLPVPVMGVAFLLLWPVLYTDANAAWRLTQRRPRLEIAAAGIMAELMLAAWALLLWGFLPDGPVRSACFFLAGAGWTLSLGLNLNPFMRFDGYHLLADHLDIPNLQSRAFVLGRWWLRRTLLGWRRPCPEGFPLRRRVFLIAYAYATWLYRLLLFTAIAVMVYHFFFKLLGLILFAVEIGWLIVRPVFRELIFLFGNRAAIGWNFRLLLTLALLGGLLFWAALPLPREITAPAIMRAERHSRIFVPFPARIDRIAIETGQRVRRGEMLFELALPESRHRQARTEARIAVLEGLLERLAGDREVLQRRVVLRERLAEARATLAGIDAQRRRLRVTAPLDGVVAEMAEGLAPGIWVKPDEPLSRIVDPRGSMVEAYPAEADLESLAALEPGALLRFIPEILERQPIEGRLAALDPVAVGTLPSPYLASRHGGEILARTDRRGRELSREARYRLTLAVPGPAPSQVLRGVVRAPGRPESLFVRARQRIAAVLIRESGF